MPGAKEHPCVSLRIPVLRTSLSCASLSGASPCRRAAGRRLRVRTPENGTRACRWCRSAPVRRPRPEAPTRSDRAWETSAPPRLLAPRPPVAAARQPRSRASAFKEAGRPRHSWDHTGARTRARARDESSRACAKEGEVRRCSGRSAARADARAARPCYGSAGLSDEACAALPYPRPLTVSFPVGNSLPGNATFNGTPWGGIPLITEHLSSGHESYGFKRCRAGKGKAKRKMCLRG
jgi:hypothetical protein